MAQIESNQNLEIDNLFCFRGKVSQSEVESIARELEQAIVTAGATKTGNPITATFGVEGTVMDLEIMIPVDKKITDTGKFYFKEKLKIGNALMAKHVGNPAGLQDTCNELNQYIMEHQLTPITVGYNVTKNVDVSNVNNTEVDIYVGINPNIDSSECPSPA